MNVKRKDGYEGNGMRKNDNNLMNVIFEYLFKINQLLFPIIIAWSIWVTNSIYALNSFMKTGERFTSKDAEIMQVNIKEWVRNNYPPLEIKKDIEVIKKTMNQIQQDLAVMTSENNIRYGKQ